MPNPPLLLCDSDALVQLFTVDDLRPLQILAKKFGIQSAVTLEVDLELRWMGKHKDRFVPQLDKALKHEILVKLDKSKFQTYLSSAEAGTSWSTFQALGIQYDGIVQRGEAYTHAAGVSLAMPVLSNDQRAVLTLIGQMLRVGIPVLRSFDVFVFAHKLGVLDIKDCENIRRELLGNGEGIPGPFLHKSFEDGAKIFPCRLQLSSPGTSVAPPSNHFDTLSITPI